MRRRDLLQAGAIAAITTTSAEAEVGNSTCASPGSAGTFVLVHGANQGGWVWRDVGEQLQGRGYRVFSPTLTGLGDRSHLVSPDISLQDHIRDIVNVIEVEELRNVILVGHSYGGTVATGVCDKMRSQVQRVIFLDANAPENGQPTIPGLTPELVEKVTGQPLQDGYLVPALPPERLGIDPADSELTEWLNRRMTGHPIRTLSDELVLHNGGTEGMSRTFILTTPKEKLQPFARKRMEQINSDTSWDYKELLVGHQAMLLAPCEVVDLFVELAADSGTPTAT